MMPRLMAPRGNIALRLLPSVNVRYYDPEQGNNPSSHRGNLWTTHCAKKIAAMAGAFLLSGQLHAGPANVEAREHLDPCEKEGYISEFIF